MKQSGDSKESPEAHLNQLQPSSVQNFAEYYSSILRVCTCTLFAKVSPAASSSIQKFDNDCDVIFMFKM